MDQEQADYADPAQFTSRWVYVGLFVLLVGLLLSACNLSGGCQLGPAPSTIRGQATSPG